MSRPSSSAKTAAWAGFDLSTTGLALGVRSPAGEEAFVQTKMRGATRWNGEPAFDLSYVPRMIRTLLQKLIGAGWQFDKTSLSFSVRQHDMVLLDKQHQVLIPALSWQCHAAGEQVQQLRRQGAEQVVGRIEERFILPKLLWALQRSAPLRRSVHQVMTTGDWIAFQLTGNDRLSTSDAISNGLLDQQAKTLAEGVIRQAKLAPSWFPQVLPSGRAVGRVNTRPVGAAGTAWTQVKQLLAGAQVVASLGDNHATGVGCGLDEQDFQTIVVSAGTSGTVNRVAPPQVTLAGRAACFEYYQNRLLLMMLADCCKWYDRFVAKFAPEYAQRLDDLNQLVLHANPNSLRRVYHDHGREIYPPDWEDCTPGEQAASTQFSIMLELLLLVQAMQEEVGGQSTQMTQYVLTGGLSQSRFLQQVFHAGVKLLSPKAKVLISARKGPLRYQTAAYGALLNAMRPEDRHAGARLCATKSAARPDPAALAHLQYLMKSQGL
ncbi:MAG: hypothetical protein GTO03_02365 [Planctomycetales bacterium]|nr:hypothetical protein [Planctomycetales bacterium]